MNLPNKLTIARMIMVPVIVAFLLLPQVWGHYLWAMLFFLLASYTDHLDGKIARTRGMITAFGKFLDPLADKILILSIFICFVKLDLCNVWLVLILLFREFAITFLRLVGAESGKVIAANKWGKSKTISQIIAVFFVLLFQILGEFGIASASTMTTLNLVGNLLIGISCVLAIISGVIYMQQNRHVIGEMK
ncbi:MAG: CDP-diacylglycerol--glycerol-3-phosphate 3-phosphatidyltransferase [Oscillospiraceae bacterium]|jgi:CDP-diacylglycerol--glycerol-3-phosphate 3-phosphatidyltransferase|nr:CDP-diacylglycerol--glycerol-3-phosphate 3-phosphatidyltransferase [Oscillospiraceae bacterium]MDD3261976.1 CDP-diacylglycerol--glycerol-3-phosphate 3-phosphatidyltransferase [Oscillospiraceae bacterium]